MAETSVPSRSMLVAMPSGDTPVSNNSVCVRSPVRVVTSAEKPCSATIPGTVVPASNCAAGTGGVRAMDIRCAGPMSTISPS